MAVSCGEAKSDLQSSERNVSPVGGGSVATIESLRARLLSERAASKEARQNAQRIALKVYELQSRLDAEVANRKKAEKAMREVLEVLKIKGVMITDSMLATFQSLGRSESEEAAQTRSSKDGESEFSSSEDASEVLSDNQKSSSHEELNTDCLELKEEETVFSENSSSDQRQGTAEDSLTSEHAEPDNDRVSKDEKVKLFEQALFANAFGEHLHYVPIQSVEASSSNQPSEIAAASRKHLEGRVSSISEGGPTTQATSGEGVGAGQPSYPLIGAAALHQIESHMAPTVNKLLADGHGQPILGSSSHVDEVASLKGITQDKNAAHATQVLSELGQRDVGPQSTGDFKMTSPMLKNMTLPVKEKASGLGQKDPQSGHLLSRGHVYEPPYMNSDPCQRMHYVPSTEAPFSKRIMNRGYPGREYLSPDVADYGGHPEAPISDTILSLIDDRNGKLGSILMALNLAKQQISDEEQCMEEIYEASWPSPYDRKHYYEGIPYQPPYRSQRQEPHNQAPIIHFPVSPRSDHETSAFDRPDGSKGGLHSAYYMPNYDSYLQPKGEVHLGNGITLYTD